MDTQKIENAQKPSIYAGFRVSFIVYTKNIFWPNPCFKSGQKPGKWPEICPKPSVQVPKFTKNPPNFLPWSNKSGL